MPEQLPVGEREVHSTQEHALLRAGVGAETQAACLDLASECTETLNETPAGRLQLVCAEEGLSLDGVEPTDLLENRYLQIAFGRPLPLSEAMRASCVVILAEELQGVPASTPAPVSEAVGALITQAEGLVAETDETETRVAGVDERIEAAETRETDRLEVLEAVETRVAGVDERIEAAETRESERLSVLRTFQVEGHELDQIGAEQAATIEAQAAAVENLIRTQVSAGNIDYYETETARLLEAQYEGEALTNAQTAAERFFAPHRENLNAMQAIFTPQEVQQVFGGSLRSTVSLNLAAQSNADIYRDLFTRIDAGFANDDDRRREVHTQVEAQLGIQLREIERPRNATELQASLREGRGTERVQVGTERVEEPPGSGIWVDQPVYEDQVIPFTPEDKLMLSHNPSVGLYPDPPGSTNYRVEGEVTGADPIRFEVDIPANGAIPEAYINREFNKALITANFHNSGLRGAMEFLTTGTDATLPVSTNTERSAIGQNDVLQKVFEVFHGINFPLEGRFATPAELQSSQNDLRWLAIDGDLGPTNQINPTLSVSLMRAVFGNSQNEIIDSLGSAQTVINTGGAEAPSIQRLYQVMHPDDVANGYPRLRGIVGDEGLALLNLNTQS